MLVPQNGNIITIFETGFIKQTWIKKGNEKKLFSTKHFIYLYYDSKYRQFNYIYNNNGNGLDQEKYNVNPYEQLEEIKKEIDLFSMEPYYALIEKIELENKLTLSKSNLYTTHKKI